jgi:lycopene cyclase domain-containing protein
VTYLLLSLPFVVAAGATALAARRARGLPSWRAVAVALAGLVVLTAVFDNVMIAADLFGYAADRRLGPTLGRAPVEDLAYPLAAVLLLPAVWHLLDRREPRRGEEPRGAGRDRGREHRP